MSIIMKKRHNKRRFGLYRSDRHLPRRRGCGSWLIVCLSGNSQSQIKKGIDVIAALGVFLQPK